MPKSAKVCRRGLAQKRQWGVGFMAIVERIGIAVFKAGIRLRSPLGQLFFSWKFNEKLSKAKIN
jgi:hypothetical protein